MSFELPPWAGAAILGLLILGVSLAAAVFFGQELAAYDGPMAGKLAVAGAGALLLGMLTQALPT